MRAVVYGQLTPHAPPVTDARMQHAVGSYWIRFPATRHLYLTFSGSTCTLLPGSSLTGWTERMDVLRRFWFANS